MTSRGPEAVGFRSQQTCDAIAEWSASRLVAVLTTIQSPTPSVWELYRRLVLVGARIVVVGDRKGPERFDLPGCCFLSLSDQDASGFALAGIMPEGHYARKNIGYLHAMREGAACIYETDDDNAPLPLWMPRAETIEGVRRLSASVAGETSRWVNVYRSFTTDLQIWPRGFPLERLADTASVSMPIDGPVYAPIQQGLVNGSPDVDAIWRLTQDRSFEFEARPSVRLEPGNWCPFNTQSTWWWPVAYPLLYIPSYCSFRMCDIWRSFVAQRCLWAIGAGVVFHAPEVRQDRNPHDSLRDFREECPGYLNNARIAAILDSLVLIPGTIAVGGNVRVCYAALIAQGLLPEREIELVDTWLADVQRMGMIMP